MQGAPPLREFVRERPDLDPIPFPADAPELREGRYRVTFARTRADLERVLALRFEVFNRELGEGLASSWRTGLDADRFDAACHHLMLIDERDGAAVGTYRLQTAAMARAAGFYCAQEFELGAPDLAELAPVLADGVELGRACIARAHRQGSALFALWRGLAAYVASCGKRYLFGCCSLTSQDPREGVALLAALARDGHVHPRLCVPPTARHVCRAEPGLPLPPIAPPPLFNAYLRHGAQVIGGPALDAEFGTIDYLVVLDLQRMPARLLRFFFAGLRGARGRGAA